MDDISRNLSNLINVVKTHRDYARGVDDKKARYLSISITLLEQAYAILYTFVKDGGD